MINRIKSLLAGLLLIAMVSALAHNNAHAQDTPDVFSQTIGIFDGFPGEDAVKQLVREYLLKTLAAPVKPQETQYRKTKQQINRNISAQEAYKMIQENTGKEHFVILDVRTPDEFSVGRIKGAMNLDYYSRSFTSKLQGLNKSMTYLVYCKSGRRSSNALGMMKEEGFQAAYNMTGGITEWIKQGYETVR
ncbi:rhodanese-like domain-containing protein [Elusimicrobiota bacterium]